MNKKWAGGIVALLLVVIVAAWALGWFGKSKYSSDPQVADLQKKAEEFAKQGPPSGEQRRTEGEAFRKQMEGLTPEQRKSFFEASMPIFMPMMSKQFEADYDKLMAMSPEEQRKELDKRIADMEQRRKEFEKQGGMGAGRGGQGRGSFAGGDPKQVDAFRKKMLDWTTPEQRAKFENGMKMLNDRRQQLGLPPVGPGRS